MEGIRKIKIGKYFIILLAVPLLTGCTSIGSFLAVQRDETHSVRTFDSSYERTWEGLVDVLSTQDNSTIVREDKGAGIILIGYDDISLSELKRIGKLPPVGISSGFRGVWLYARKKIDYSIKAVSPDETEVKVVYYLQSYNASGKRWINIAPNGVRETEIFDKLKDVLNKS